MVIIKNTGHFGIPNNYSGSVGNDVLFASFCERINLPELATDPRFASNVLRQQNRVVLIDKIKQRMLEKTCDEWLQIFEGLKVPYGPVNDMKHAFDDPQVRSLTINLNKLDIAIRKFALLKKILVVSLFFYRSSSTIW